MNQREKNVKIFIIRIKTNFFQKTYSIITWDKNLYPGFYFIPKVFRRIYLL